MSCYILHMSSFWSPDKQIQVMKFISLTMKAMWPSCLPAAFYKNKKQTFHWHFVLKLREFSSKHTFFVMLCIDKYVNNIDQWRRLESLKGTNYTAYLFWSIILRAFIKERWNVKTDSRSSYSYCNVLSCLCYYCHSRTT